MLLWQGDSAGQAAPPALPAQRLSHDFVVVDVQFFPRGDRLLAVGPSRAVVWELGSGRALLKIDREIPKVQGRSLLDAQAPARRRGCAPTSENVLSFATYLLQVKLS